MSVCLLTALQITTDGLGAAFNLPPEETKLLWIWVMIWAVVQLEGELPPHLQSWMFFIRKGFRVAPSAHSQNL